MLQSAPFSATVKMMGQNIINDRSWYLLKTLIERYIREGQPIGSKTLAEDSNLSLSSASIRSVMCELEKAGFVYSPHTSAGRIPTQQGYRLFVDRLLTVNPLSEEKVQDLKEKISLECDSGSLIKKASNLLSEMTKLAGLVSAPKKNQIKLQHIEFLSLSDNRVLTILVFDQHEIQNRIIITDRQYAANELQEAANFLNEQYSGKDLLSIRKKLIDALKYDKKRMNDLMQSAINLANQAFQQESESDEYIITGETHLLENAQADNVGRLSHLFRAFNQKQEILHLLDKCLNADKLQIFLGKEAGSEVFDDFSIVTAPYEIDGHVMGVLGVIGPTRMQYEHAISAVNITARLLSDALKKG